MVFLLLHKALAAIFLVALEDLLSLRFFPAVLATAEYVFTEFFFCVIIKTVDYFADRHNGKAIASLSHNVLEPVFTV